MTNAKANPDTNAGTNAGKSPDAPALALTRRTRRSGAIEYAEYADVQGRIWTTFESVGFTDQCARCGAAIRRGLWRVGSDEYVCLCSVHAHVAGE